MDGDDLAFDTGDPSSSVFNARELEKIKSNVLLDFHFLSFDVRFERAQGGESRRVKLGLSAFRQARYSRLKFKFNPLTETNRPILIERI